MSTRRRGRVNTGGIGAALATTVAVAVVLGLIVGTGPTLAGGESLSVRSRGEGDEATEHIKWSKGRRGIEVWTRGEVRFKRDFTDVERIAKGGRFKLRERDGFVYASVTVEPAEDGTLEYSYYVSGFPSAWDDEARQWFRKLLPEAVEKTGIGAETMARDLLETAGVDGVLTKIEELPADRVRLVYYNVLLDSGSPEPGELARIARHVGREVESDHYKHQVLDAILEEHRSDEELATAVADASQEFESDHYRAGVLSTLARRGETSDAFFESVAEMNSDHYRSVVLKELDELEPTEPVCAAIERMGSDHYRTEILLSMKPLPATPPVLDLIASMSSDHYRHVAVNAILENTVDTPEEWAGLLELTRSFDSDHYKATLLTEMAPEMTVDASTVEAFLLTTSTLSSDHHTSEVVKELLRRDDLDEDALKDVLALVRSDIGSTYHRGQLVEQIAARIIE